MYISILLKEFLHILTFIIIVWLMLQIELSSSFNEMRIYFIPLGLEVSEVEFSLRI
jgi:hypothetical protein